MVEEGEEEVEVVEEVVPEQRGEHNSNPPTATQELNSATKLRLSSTNHPKSNR